MRWVRLRDIMNKYIHINKLKETYKKHPREVEETKGKWWWVKTKPFGQIK